MSNLINYLGFFCAAFAFPALSDGAFANSPPESMTIRYTSGIIQCNITSKADIEIIREIVDREIAKKIPSVGIRSRQYMRLYSMQIDAVRGGVRELYTLRTASLLENMPNYVEIESNGKFYLSREDYLIGIDRVTKHGRAHFCRKLSSR